jgi:hypothetical protein
MRQKTEVRGQRSEDYPPAWKTDGLEAGSGGKTEDTPTLRLLRKLSRAGGVAK